MDIYLINLLSAKERREFQIEQLGQLGLGYEIINARTVKDISEETYKKHYFDWQRPLRRTEVACYYSHRSVWAKVAKSRKSALILEDDVLLSTDLPNILHYFDQTEPDEIDLVNLEVRARKKCVGRQTKSITEISHIVKLFQDSTGAAAYILFPSGAKKILALEDKKGIALADAHIFSCPNLSCLQVEPAAAIQFDQCEKYGITLQEKEINLAISSVSSRNKEPREHIFLYKRAYSQVKLGLKKIQMFFMSKRRKIKINPQLISTQWK